MSSSFFKTFSRSVVKHKWFYSLNITSLTVGLAAFALSVLYFEHELGYDSYHPDPDRVFRISGKVGEDWLSILSLPYSQAIHDGQLSGIESSLRLRRWSPKYVHVGNEKFFESNVLFTDVDSKFLDFFGFSMIEGDRATALAQNGSVVLTRKIAKKYFGDEVAVGKSIRFDTLELMVTGVLENLPTNTHLVGDFIIAHKNQAVGAWGHFTYIKPSDGVDITTIESRLLNLAVPTTIYNKAEALSILPIQNLHYGSNFTFDFKAPGNYYYLILFGIVGVLILTISAINFIALTFAIFSTKTKDAAIRKSVGATSTSLRNSFIIECGITVLACVVICLVTTQFATPFVNDFLKIEIKSVFHSYWALGSLFMVSMSIAIVSALYPTTLLAHVKITDLFKNKGLNTPHGLSFRQLLLLAQFTVLFFVLGTFWVVKTQFNYIQNKDLGFSKEGVVKIKRAWGIDSTKYQYLKNELIKLPDVLVVSMGYVPSDDDYGVSFAGEDPLKSGKNLLIHGADFDYLEVLGLKSLSGVTLTEPKENWPSRVVLINQTLAKQLGYEDAIGRKVVINPQSASESSRIIDGVIADFNFRSLHEPIVPQMIVLNKNPRVVNQNILIKTNNQSVALMNYLERKIDEVAPNVPVQLSLLESDISVFYSKEEQLHQAMDFLSIASVLLSFSGLVILSTYLIHLKRKSTAIHRILGAKASEIVRMLLSPFVGIAFVSFVIGTIASYFTAERWLTTFAFRTEMGFMPFILIFLLTLSIISLMVFTLSIKAVNVNPALVLKEEN